MGPVVLSALLQSDKLHICNRLATILDVTVCHMVIYASAFVWVDQNLTHSRCFHFVELQQSVAPVRIVITSRMGQGSSGKEISAINLCTFGFTSILKQRVSLNTRVVSRILENCVTI